MNEKLIEYLKKHLEMGSDMERVKQALMSAGHDINTVQEHLNHVLKYKKVKEYIKKHVELGSDIDKVKQVLLSAGYDINIVEEQLKSALESDKNRKHKLKTVKLTIAAIVLVIIISAAGFYYFSNFYNKASPVINQSGIDEIKYQKNLESFNQALIANDTNACDKIEEDSLKIICEKKFAPQNQSCDEQCMDKNLLNAALINRNSTLCIGISDLSLKTQCQQIVK